MQNSNENRQPMQYQQPGQYPQAGQYQESGQYQPSGPYQQPAQYQQPMQPQQPQNGEPHEKPRKKKGRFGKGLRVYLMTVGALTTLAALVLLVVWLLVEIGKVAPGA